MNITTDDENAVDGRSDIDSLEKVYRLPFWIDKPSSITALTGGITNQNYLVDAGGKRYVVRLGGDIPINHVIRFNEHAASRAAADLGISPKVHYTESDVLVMDYVQSTSLRSDQVWERLPRIVELMRNAHRGMMRRMRGPAMSYWLFHVIRDNLHTLKEREFDADLQTLMRENDDLEASLGSIDLVFCHNDWLPANILEDETRLWLIDWDYAGFNSPLADLGSLASNNLFTSHQEKVLLENYFERSIDARCQREYLAMKAASLLKETLWSMCSQCFSTIDFDYASYSRMNLARYQSALADFRSA